MKKSYILCIAAMTVMAVSCTKEIEVTNDNVNSEVINPKVVVAKTDDNIASKTSLDGLNVIWSSTDVIMGFSDAKQTSTKTEVSLDGSTATFTFGTLSIEDDLYYLIYPASAVGEADLSTANITIPTTQTATANGFANDANIAWAEGGVADDQVSFKNAGGLLGITINNDNITSVELMADEVMTGAGTIDVSTGEATPGAGSKTVLLNGGLVNGSEYYAVVYPGTYHNLKIIITNSEGKKAVFTNSNTLTVDRNSITQIATLTASKWYSVVDHTISWTQASDWTGGSDVLTLVDGDYNVELNKTDAGTTNPTIAAALDARVYAKGLVTVSCINRMTSITFNISTQGQKRLAAITANVGSIATQSTGASTVVWTGVAKEVVFSVGSSAVYGTDGSSKAGQLCFDNIDVKVLDDGKTPQTLSFPESSYSVTYGNSFEAPALSGANTTVTYSSSNTSIATVNSSTGAVTINTNSVYGTTRITASAAADATHRSASTYYDLTVNAPITLTYNINGVATNVNGSEGQLLSELLPVSPNCGISGYSFSGWSESIVAETDTKPTYTTQTTLPAGGLTLYAVFVKETVNNVDANTVEFTPDACKTSAGEFSHINAENGLTMTVSNGICNADQFRIYKNQTLTITSSERNITSIVITCGDSKYPASGFGEESATWAIDGINGTWTGNTKTVTLTASVGQVRSTKISVSLAAGQKTTYGGYTTSPSAS